MKHLRSRHCQLSGHLNDISSSSWIGLYSNLLLNCEKFVIMVLQHTYLMKTQYYFHGMYSTVEWVVLHGHLNLIHRHQASLIGTICCHV